MPKKHGIDTDLPKSISDDVKKEVDKVKNDFGEVSGSIKRKF